MRKCNQCEFSASFEGVDSQKHELVAMSDHLTSHNPSPAEWTEAYRRMQQAKDASKRKAKEE